MAPRIFKQRGFTLLEVLMFSVLVLGPISMWLTDEYLGKQALAVVDRAPGAGAAHWKRAGSAYRLLHLSSQVRDSRATGHYQKVVDAWIAASETPKPSTGDAPKAAWVFELEASEQRQVLVQLESLGVKPAALQPLHEKLEKISPQFSAAEEKTLEVLSSSSAMVNLAILQNRTDQDLASKLLELGASKGGLKKIRFLD